MLRQIVSRNIPEAENTHHIPAAKRLIEPYDLINVLCTLWICSKAFETLP